MPPPEPRDLLVDDLDIRASEPPGSSPAAPAAEALASNSGAPPPSVTDPGGTPTAAILASALGPSLAPPYSPPSDGLEQSLEQLDDATEGSAVRATLPSTEDAGPPLLATGPLPPKPSSPNVARPDEGHPELGTSEAGLLRQTMPSSERLRAPAPLPRVPAPPLAFSHSSNSPGLPTPTNEAPIVSTPPGSGAPPSIGAAPVVGGGSAGEGAAHAVPAAEAPSLAAPADSAGPNAGTFVTSTSTFGPAALSVEPPNPQTLAQRHTLIQRLSLAAGAACVLVMLLLVFTGSDTGRLVVSVAGPDGTPVAGVKVFVDDQLSCEASPCILEEVEASSHLVAVEAEGYSRTAEQAVVVRDSQDTALNVVLSSRLGANGSSNAMAGSERGAASGQSPEPVEAAGEAPGQEPSTSAGQQPEDDDSARPDRESAAPSEPPEEVPTLSGAELPSEKNERANERGSGAVSTNAAASRATKTAGRQQPTPTRKGSSTRAATNIEGANGTLNLNSIPPSTVLLNGRPLGITPKAGISVKPGSYSIVFVHPEKGRKRATAEVSGGGSRTVSVRFSD